MNKTFFILILSLSLPFHLRAQEVIDQAANAAIRAEASSRTQVMHTLHVLTDRYGARLTGSPNYDAAARWAARQLTDWGLKNVRLEPWDFGHPGWANERAEGRLVSPITVDLDFRVAAWTPSTNGAVAASAVQLIPPQGSVDELAAWLKANESNVSGRIVLFGKASAISAGQADKEKAAMETPPPRDPNRLIANQREEIINKWLATCGTLVRLYDGAGPNGVIHEVHNRTFEAANAPPGVILRNEDYGRIERLLQDGEDVRLEFNIANHWYPEGRTTFNVLAEIPGAEKPDEVIMLGAHLDSWNLATGATDNAAGVAMMMEAVRVIQAAGLKPARTIRIGLWSAEEQGLLGSQAYVREHLGSYEKPKPDFSRVLCYFNIDSGAGSVRSVMVFGPEAEQTVLREAIAPFADMGAGGSSSFLSRAIGSTDSSSFSHAGISTIDLMQNSTDYGSTHHTNLDTIEHVTPEELIKGATVIAAALWHVANRPAPLPLFDKSTMPPPVPEP
ncbi:MAG TPA: M20/M25/M40 family metallo-hydrolase [Acidobacteriota bacterium]|nr:M20/M25/M40 family metallo-hydrolase [Acidobacteriota bacterium]